MSKKKLMYENFLAQLNITKKYLDVVIFDNDKKVFRCEKVDRRYLSDEEIIKRTMFLMKTIFNVFETNKLISGEEPNYDYDYIDSYAKTYSDFYYVIRTKCFKVSYYSDEIEKILRKRFDYVNINEKIFYKFMQLDVTVQENYEIKNKFRFYLDRPMNKETLIEKTKKEFIKNFGM